MDDILPFIDQVAKGQSLTASESAQAFKLLISGKASDAQIAGFLMALRVRGETVPEITGAAQTMRTRARAVEAPSDAIDIVGTGGDAKGTYNISTCTALVVAACGIPVAKHGNRSISSRSGSADVLEALGVNLALEPSQVARCIRDAGVGFMFAQNHHTAMKYVMPARKELATRTIFNLLGPLTNPAGTKNQVIGVYARDWIIPLAEVMKNLGSHRVWVVHGSDGMDELTTTGPTFVAELHNNEVTSRIVTPEDAGLPLANPDDLLGGDARENAAAITALLAGETGAFRDIVLLNAASALMVANQAFDLKEGVLMAASAIDDGKAAATLAKLVAASNGQ